MQRSNGPCGPKLSRCSIAISPSPIIAAFARVGDALAGDEATPRERVAATRKAHRAEMVAAMMRSLMLVCRVITTLKI
jgi:hypothetical protein